MKKSKLFLVMAVILSSLMLFAACGTTTPPADTTGDTTDTTDTTTDGTTPTESTDTTPTDTTPADTTPVETTANIFINNGVDEQFPLTYTGELTPEILVEGLSNVLGYKIETNSIVVAADRITVDLKATSAPVAEAIAIEGVTPLYTFADADTYVYCILNSINETLGQNYSLTNAVYFTVDGAAYTFANLATALVVSADAPYVTTAPAVTDTTVTADTTVTDTTATDVVVDPATDVVG